MEECKGDDTTFLRETRTDRDVRAENRSAQKKKSRSAQENNTGLEVDLRNPQTFSTSCPLFLGAHVSAEYLQKIKNIIDNEDSASFIDPKGYGARPREAYSRAFETPLGSRMAGAAEAMCQQNGPNSEVGRAFIERLPYSVVRNVRAGCLG